MHSQCVADNSTGSRVFFSFSKIKGRERSSSKNKKKKKQIPHFPEKKGGPRNDNNKRVLSTQNYRRANEKDEKNEKKKQRIKTNLYNISSLYSDLFGLFFFFKNLFHSSFFSFSFFYPRRVFSSRPRRRRRRGRSGRTYFAYCGLVLDTVVFGRAQQRVHRPSSPPTAPHRVSRQSRRRSGLRGNRWKRGRFFPSPPFPPSLPLLLAFAHSQCIRSGLS